MPTNKELPVLPFASALLWEQWLSEHHAQFDGIWIKVAKKAAGIASVTHDEALDVALCYGWIDGQRNSDDDSYFLQKFTPRRSKSLWSKRNVDKAAKLAAAGRMQPAGLVEVEAAKQDGRWEAAYESSKNMVVPEDFLEALEQNKQAQVFFHTLSKANIYSIAWRLKTAQKPATRKRRFDTLLAMLARGEFP
ncbi:MAG: YdeI/OmpD-associated family protein [Chloroflexota bacterium]